MKKKLFFIGTFGIRFDFFLLRKLFGHFIEDIPWVTAIIWTIHLNPYYICRYQLHEIDYRYVQFNVLNWTSSSREEAIFPRDCLSIYNYSIPGFVKMYEAQKCWKTKWIPCSNSNHTSLSYTQHWPDNCSKHVTVLLISIQNFSTKLIKIMLLRF